MAFPLGITTVPPYGAYKMFTKPYEAANCIDALTGRSLSPAPSDLTRVLYIPYHNRNSSHIPLYDVSAQYHDAVGNAAVGGSEFKTKLCIMRKPTANTIGVDVKYLVWFNQEMGFATVEERCLGADGQQIHLSLPVEEDQDLSLTITSPSIRPKQYITPSSSSSPTLVPRGSKETTQPSPSYLISGNRRDEKANLEWHINPARHGGTRYTLVDQADGEVRAIYHHAGLESSMPGHYSEGVVLLPRERDPERDAVAVASLLGLLWDIRSRMVTEKKKKPLFSNPFGKK